LLKPSYLLINNIPLLIMNDPTTSLQILKRLHHNIMVDNKLGQVGPILNNDMFFNEQGCELLKRIVGLDV